VNAALTLQPGERRVLRLFALDLPRAEVEGLEKSPEGDDLLSALLGVDALDRAAVEVFDVEDLTGIGLAGYLMAGDGIPEAQIEPDRQRLEEVTGGVLLVYSEAFPARPLTLTPDPRLRLIGLYREDTPQIVFEPLPDAAAMGEVPQGKPVWSNARIGGMVATAVLIFLAIFTVLFIWMAG
jgi:hypothetical protein